MKDRLDLVQLDVRSLGNEQMTSGNLDQSSSLRALRDVLKRDSRALSLTVVVEGVRSTEVADSLGVHARTLSAVTP